LGYLVTQPRKHMVPGRPKTAEEEIDLVAIHPLIRETKLPDSILWTTRDLKTVPRAIVAVRGWHERFYASTFEQTPDLLRFVEPESLRCGERLLGTTDMAKILCLPRLPASGSLKEKTVALLKEKGIDGVLTFRTILAHLVASVDVRRNYEKSDLLQTIRLLKTYDFLKDPQLELFGKKRKKD
jgi:hypothetical protein